MRFFRGAIRWQVGKYFATIFGVIFTFLRLDKFFEQWMAIKRNRFFLNVICGVFIAIALHFATYTGIGQQLLNETYDYLAKKDFQRTVIQGRDEPISDAIRLIAFDKETYESSPSQGFWTPRELLGKTIIRAIELGSKVVVVDFALDMPAFSDDENQQYLSLLKEAANLAEKNKTVIILPQIEKEKDNEYARQYRELLKEKSRVIKQGSIGVFFNPLDLKVRHFRFYETDLSQKRAILSIPILAALYHWHGLKRGDKIRKRAESLILEPDKSENVISIPSNGSADAIRLYPQSPSRECLPARYKFRIVPRAIIKEFGHGNDPLIPPIMLTPEPLLRKNPPQKIYQNKIVLIGSTYEGIGDIHFTPIGKMPGLFLVANGLNIFLKGEQIHEHRILKFLIGCVLILLSSVIFLYFPTVLAAIFLTLLLLIVNTPISIWLFNKWGLFLDFWLMVVGIGIFENIIGLYELLEDYSKKGKEDEE